MQVSNVKGVCFCLEKSQVESIRLVSMVISSAHALETLRQGFQMAFLQPNLREIILDDIHVAKYLEDGFADWIKEIATLVESLGIVSMERLSCWNVLLPQCVSEGLKGLDLSFSDFSDVTETLSAIMAVDGELEELVLQGIVLNSASLEVLETSKTLKKLDLGNCGLYGQTSKALVALMSKKLQQISLAYNTNLNIHEVFSKLASKPMTLNLSILSLKGLRMSRSDLGSVLR